MKIGYYCFASLIHDQESITSDSEAFINSLAKASNCEFIKVTEADLNKYDLTLLFIQTGGTESMFKDFFMKHKLNKYLLLAYSAHNSLAASMEILSYLHNCNCKAEILHGSFEYIVDRINQNALPNDSLGILQNNRLGIIGKPSDWLISSNIDYVRAKDIFGLDIVDISMNEFNDSIALAHVNNDDNYLKEIENKPHNNLKLTKSFSIYQALTNLTKKYNLDGLTVRCFDILSTQHSTSCVGLAILNARRITATCEGDFSALITMHFVNKVLGQPSFQANPSSIDTSNKEIVFAHCTLPLNMCLNYSLDTHFESGIGVAIKGQLPLQVATIVKISADLTRYYVEKATIMENLNEKNLCRTQIRLKIDKGVKYFLTEPLGNHHVIVLGDYVDEINKLLSRKLKRV